VKLREGTYDAAIAKEVSAYRWMDVAGKTVMDIGGCFGAASVMFMEGGAKRVVIIEPEADNLKMIRQNLRSFGSAAEIIAGAVGPEDGTAELFINNGINTGGHSLHVTRGRKGVKVPLFSFRKLLAKYKPAAIKIDCEGAEYDFLTEPLPSYVKQVAMEIHLNKKRWREQAPELIKLFDGWEVVRQPSLRPSNWHTIGGFRR
jgi:FkbM family methyltransferase